MTIVHVTSKSLKKGSQYAASECYGKDLYRLTAIEVIETEKDKDADWVVKVDVKIARKIRQSKDKTESFKQAVNRLLEFALSCNHAIVEKIIIR
jgi:hypothetical protein